MTTIESLPTELRRKIMGFLGTRDKLAAAEAAPTFDEACDVQIEHQTYFQSQRDKSILVLIVAETDCIEALKMALKHYSEIHLLLARSVVEEGNCDKLFGLRIWMDAVTDDGESPFTSIELVGQIPSCACGFGMLTRFAITVFFTEDQSEVALRTFARQASQAYNHRRVYYNGTTRLEVLSTVSGYLHPKIELRY